ncbi:MAG: hypothetical protein BGO31_03685 [Bacteroidetes bacterium 43-16]|nr:MAG: hypothetical protein BGO31_03685 [Bacteroidetes bacterium 43-16]
MRCLSLICVFGCLGLVACNNNSNKLNGTWKPVLPAEKLALIENAFQENEAEIRGITEVTPGLAMQYDTENLDTLKTRMLDELRQQYEPQSHNAYKFTKDGFLILYNEKNQGEDTLFNYELDGNELNFSLIDESKAYTESIFEEGGSLNIFKVNKDSLVLTMSAGTFEDTIYMRKENK